MSGSARLDGYEGGKRVAGRGLLRTEGQGSQAQSGCAAASCIAGRRLDRLLPGCAPPDSVEGCRRFSQHGDSFEFGSCELPRESHLVGRSAWTVEDFESDVRAVCDLSPQAQSHVPYAWAFLSVHDLT